MKIYNGNYIYIFIHMHFILSLSRLMREILDNDFIYFIYYK